MPNRLEGEGTEQAKVGKKKGASLSEGWTSSNWSAGR